MMEKIRVLVTAYSRVQYSQYREITPEQFAEYERICENEAPRDVDRKLNDFVDQFIRTDDVSDADDYEDVEIVRVDAAGKPIPEPPESPR